VACHLRIIQACPRASVTTPICRYRVVQIITNHGDDLQKYATETVLLHIATKPNTAGYREQLGSNGGRCGAHCRVKRCRTARS